MKPLITFLACLAAGAIITAAAADWWPGVIGQLSFVFLVGAIIFIAHLWGIQEGIEIGQKDSSLKFNIGYQAGRSRKW